MFADAFFAPDTHVSPGRTPPDTGVSPQSSAVSHQRSFTLCSLHTPTKSHRWERRNMLITHSLSSLVSAQKPGHLLFVVGNAQRLAASRAHTPQENFQIPGARPKKIDRFGHFLDPWTHMFRYPSDTPLRPLFRPARTNIYYPLLVRGLVLEYEERSEWPTPRPRWAP